MHFTTRLFNSATHTLTLINIVEVNLNPA